MFVTKYRPKSLKEYVDQKEAVRKFLEWIKKWEPGKKAILLYGPPGTGKTCLVEAFALENNYELIQMNASDVRSKKKIEKIFGQSMVQQSLFGKKKIFLIDEIDGLSGREDRGGVSAVIEIIKKSRFPVVLTANDPYDKKISFLRNYCEMVQFKSIPVWDIEKKLKEIASKEKIKIDKEVINILAKRSKGDIRAAITDLEVLARGERKITKDSVNKYLSYREREDTIFNVLKIIFKTSSLMSAKLSLNNVDMDPETIFWWIENNIVNEYEKPEEIAKAYNALSLADLYYTARIRKRNNWKLMTYMIDFMTGGVALSKNQIYRKFTKYRYPDKIIVLGGSKLERKEEKERLNFLRQVLHCSSRKIRSEFYPYLQKFIEKNFDKIRQNYEKEIN